MGMTEVRHFLVDEKRKAEDPALPVKDRIMAWCSWGRLSRNSYDASLALRNIEDLMQQTSREEK